MTHDPGNSFSASNAGDAAPNPEIPPAVARAFVAFMREKAVALDWTERSMVQSFDRILDTPIWNAAAYETIRVVASNVGGQDVEFDMQSAASAYLGETLARLFNGQWSGHFACDAGVNFYTSYVAFGEFRLYPVRWLSYRLTNGPGEGTVNKWLRRIKPSIVARTDRTRSLRGDGTS